MFIVIELQTNSEGSVSHIVTNYADKNAAESKFHQILAAAALSNLPVHSALMVDEIGMLYKQDGYDRRIMDGMSYLE